MKRWDKAKQNWDLEMFFVAMSCIDDAVIKIIKFLNLGKEFVSESELNDTFKEFRKIVKKYKIKAIRNDLIHREDAFKQQNKKKKPLPKKPILIFGGYNFTTDEYKFNIHKIKLSEIFSIIHNFKKDIKSILDKKLENFYQVKEVDDYKSMIPFSLLHSFEKIKPNKRAKLK